MPKPRRRRRFFALEGRFEVGDSGEPQGMLDPASADPTAASNEDAVVYSDEIDPSFISSEDAVAEAGEIDPRLGEFEEEAGASEPSGDDSLPPAFRLNRAPRSRPAPKRLISFPAMLLGLVCLIVGLSAGYLWPRSGQKPAVTDATAGTRKEASPLTQADQDDLDEAYAARHAHRYADTERIFAELGRRHADWGSIQVEIGRTLFYENKPYDATAALKKSVEKGWKPAEANFLLGVLSKAQRSYANAETSFAKAVEIDPTQPDYYFFWGECLREQGKLLDATAKFRSALLRNQYETATGLYRAKLWLCAIDADQASKDGENSEIDAFLTQPHPPMEAFVAAAARDLKAGDLHAAAAHLSSASLRADPVVFHYIIGDPIFDEVRMKPEFADMFQPDSPAAIPQTETGASSPTPAAAH